MTPLKNSATPGTGAGGRLLDRRRAPAQAAAVARDSGNTLDQERIITAPNTAEPCK